MRILTLPGWSTQAALQPPSWSPEQARLCVLWAKLPGARGPSCKGGWAPCAGSTWRSRQELSSLQKTLAQF